MSLRRRASATSFTADSPPNPSQFEQADRPAFTQTGKIDFDCNAIWMLATNRPPKPAIERIAWAAREEISRPGAGSWQMRKSCVPRLYLSRPWFASGEDELLALIFGPSGLLDDDGFTRPTENTNHPPSYCANPPEQPGWPSANEKDRLSALKQDTFATLDNDLADIAGNICRWGADPILDTMQNNPLQALIPPDVFAGHVARAQNIPMPLSHPPKPDDLTQTWTDDPTLLRDVAVLLYRPQFDGNSGLHYVDVEIDVAAVHMSFIRLAIGRFQPHAARKLWLSAPLVADAIQIPSPRTATVTLTSPSSIRVEVRGNGYRSRQDLDANTVEMPPRMSIRLLRKGRASDAWLAAFDDRGMRIEALLLAPLPANGAHPPHADQPLVWETALALPATLDVQQYAVQIDELDQHFADRDVPGAPAAAIVEHPAMFSCLVVLGT